jgi:hypothetical protein
MGVATRLVRILWYGTPVSKREMVDGPMPTTPKTTRAAETGARGCEAVRVA